MQTRVIEIELDDSEYEEVPASRIWEGYPEICLICECTGKKTLRDIESGKLIEVSCDCEWVNPKHELLDILAAHSGDSPNECTN